MVDLDSNWKQLVDIIVISIGEIGLSAYLYIFLVFCLIEFGDPNYGGQHGCFLRFGTFKFLFILATLKVTYMAANGWINMLLFLFALIFNLHPVFGMLTCDPVFVKHLEQYLSSQLPSDVPNRQVFLDGLNNEILDVYQSYFKQKKYLRIIDIRSVAKLKELVFSNLKGKKFEGMNAHWLLIRKIRSELTQAMKKSLEEFADLACSEDCSMIEGPALDSWTCLRIRAQCFDGSVCGEDDDRDAEKKEVKVYLVLIAEFTVLSCILLLAYIYIYHSCKIQMKLPCKEKDTVPLAKKELEANLEDGTD